MNDAFEEQQKDHPADGAKIKSYSQICADEDSFIKYRIKHLENIIHVCF